jgi:hypothetical protein
VSFDTITLCVASQRVFVVVVISLSTQSGNFWIHPRMFRGNITLEINDGRSLFLLMGSLRLICFRVLCL